MAEPGRLLRPGLLRGWVICLSVLTFTLTSPTPAGAQTSDPIQELDRRLTELSASLEQAKKAVAVSGELDKVSAQLEAVKRQLEVVRAREELRRSSTVSSPPASWWPLSGVGFALIGAWILVSWLREGTRRREVKAQAQTRDAAAVIETYKLIETSVDARVEWLVALVRADRKAEPR
jgi:hypothetical protein